MRKEFGEEYRRTHRCPSNQCRPRLGRDSAGGASASLNRTISEIMTFLSNQGRRPCINASPRAARSTEKLNAHP
jgi:hypothetical protein